MLLTDIIYISDKRGIKEINDINEILFPGDKGFFEYTDKRQISFTERALLLHNFQTLVEKINNVNDDLKTYVEYLCAKQKYVDISVHAQFQI